MIFNGSEAYSAIEYYLSSKSSTQAKRLKADIIKNSNQSLVLCMDDHEEVSVEFEGIKLWWSSGKNISKSQIRRELRLLGSSFCSGNDSKRMLSFAHCAFNFPILMSQNQYFAHRTSKMVFITHLLTEEPERLAGPLLKGRNAWYGQELTKGKLTLDLGDSIKWKGMTRPFQLFQTCQ
ncbi:hypothetical protein QYF36_024872 [Acer negundo]|nr:hypothetical protein QYF36_024872 [Acer negundo]